MQDIIDFFKGLFSAQGFIPRWICGDWTDFHGWFYIISDGLIWLAYFAIPILLFYYLVKRSELPFLRVFWWFIAFILFCGLTHLIEVVIFWYPVYRLSAFVKFITAIVSVVTVFVLIKYLPKALQAKSPKFLQQEIERKTKELKSLNEELNIQKLKFETIMNASSAGLILFDEKAKVENANSRAAEIFGYSIGELEKLELNNLLPTNFDGFHSKMFQKFMAQPTERQMGVGRDLNGKHKNGKLIPVEIGLSPMKVNDEQKVLATINDIELRKLKVEQKEKEILDFKELNKKLETKNEELEDVSYIVSHNLRSPIQNIKGLLDLTEDKDFEYYDKFRILVDRLSFTVDDLNKVIQQNNMSIPNAETVEFSSSLARVLKSLSLKIENANAQIETDFGVEAINYPISFIDSYFLNLITNAIKYSKDEIPPLITIKTELTGGFIKLSCKDNGKGINMEKHGDKLFRFGKTFHKHSDSRGIGLYMLNKQIERLGGYIKVNSEVNVGSEFSLYLKNQ